MAFFWDSSAIVALIFDEQSSDAAIRAWQADSTRLAWHWMLVETHASLVRRRATGFQMEIWSGVVRRFNWVELPTDDFPVVITRNTSWRLRSADAGHVYLFEEFLIEGMDVKLVTFDCEMRSLCENRGWPVWRG